MFFFGSLLLSCVETRLTGPIQFGSVHWEPDRIMQWIRRVMSLLEGNQYTFAYFFVYQGNAVMVALTLTGAVLVGNDLTHRSLPFYLSKPLNRWHYIGGKCLACAAVINLLVTVPALLLYAQHGMDDLSYFVDPDFFC